MQQTASKSAVCRTWVHRRRVWLGALVLLGALFVVYPILGGWVGARLLVGRLADRLALDVRIGRARATWAGTLRIEALAIEIPPDVAQDDVAQIDAHTKAAAVRLHVEAVEIPFSTLRGQGKVRVSGPRVLADGFEALHALRVRLGFGEAATAAEVASTSEPPTGRRLPRVDFERGMVEIGVTGKRHLFIRDLRGHFESGRELTVEIGGLAGDMRRTPEGEEGFGAERISVTVALNGNRPRGIPVVSIDGGYVQLSPHLGLSGITGSIGHDESDPGVAVIALRGSYGGARETLWNADGRVRPARDVWRSQANLSLRAERFLLSRIREVLPPAFVEPERTSVDADLALEAEDGRIRVNGGVRISALALFHPALASDTVRGLHVSSELDATVDVNAHSAHIKHFIAKIGDLTAKLSGELALHEKPFVYGNGQQLPWTPAVELALDIPKVSCERLLGSFPATLVPHLQGFELRGDFETHLLLNVDFSHLDALTLKGKVGIDGCRVQSAPAHVTALADPQAILTREVEVPPAWNDPSEKPEILVFQLGPDNEDFVPYQQIGKHVVNAVLTTEDSRFFQHRGFAVAEFRTALRRNLSEGGFRLGASSITMQSVKNLLLTHEKTLSRKLQELFLVWYLEQILSKERILELYFNAIEFGPRLYGIGPAARHYFGKAPADLTPAEAAFIASLLPSPKRRYAQYCRGALSPDWLRHIRRVLTRMRERDRLTEEEYTRALETTPTFDLNERGMDERQCLEWVKRLTQRIEEPASDTPAGEL